MQKNILLSLRNITRHLTEKKISILLDYKIILSIIILLNLFSIFPINSISNTPALEYSNDTNLEFTFNPTLSLSLSGNLIIDNLIPGSSSDSNSINVNISTNNVTGYNLSATVGSSNNATTNLTNSSYSSNSNNDYIFTSLNTNDSLVSLTTDNTWGYSYSTDNGTTWSNYSGLPLYTSTPTSLFTIYNPSADTINFKIGARSSSNQPLGEYTNTINFIATTYPSPLTLEESYAYYGKEKVTITDPDTGITGSYYKLQDMTTNICKTSDIPSELLVVDTRDNQTYIITHLLDDNCWMTNLNLGDIDNYPLTVNKLDYTNTNLPDDTAKEISSATFNSWKASSGSATYITPEYIPLNTSNTSNGLDADPVSNTKYGILYNYCATSANTYCYAGGSGVGNAEYDLCPTNWRLPTGGSNGEFYNLVVAYGYTSENTSSTNLRKSFADGGAGFGMAGNFYDSAPVQQSARGYYWSSTVSNSSGIYTISLNVSTTYPTNDYSRYHGFSIRCLAK